MQLDTTPPHLVSGGQRSYHKYRLSAASRNSTPRSTRSLHSTATRRTNSPAKPVRKEYPLILLHVTLLPVACHYSAAVLDSVLPASTIQNWTLLQEKVSATMLERGILIPHPREDYDLLEERLLESLELKAPRILKCGHFHLSPEEEAEIAASEEEYDSDPENCLDVCEDCGRRVRDGRFGAGSGQQRWSIKVYASNGLMRAGAWGAAWQEMERVDVEILPWLDDRMRRELDLRREEEDRMAAQHGLPPTMDEQRRKEVYGEDAGPFGAEFGEYQEPASPRTHDRREVPLTELLSMHVQQVLQDRRNLAIALLSVLVVLLAIGMGLGSNAPARSLQPMPSPEIMVQPVPSAEITVQTQVVRTVVTPSLVETVTALETPEALAGPAAKVEAAEAETTTKETIQLVDAAA